MRALTFLAVPVLAPLTDALAQELPLRPGRRLRVTAPALGSGEILGRLDLVRRDTLRVVADSVLSIPLAGITRLEVSRGKSLLPVVLGAVVGTAAGGAVGIAVANASDCPFLDPCEEDLLGPPVFGAAIGALAGAALGVAFRRERWEEVPLDRLRVSIVPQRGGRLGFGMSLRF